MGHACEWETSMMLRLAPQLVKEFKKLGAVEPGAGFAPATRGWITKERTVPGHIGHPREASGEKGEALFKVFTDGLTGFLERVTAWDGKGWNG
jgi:creatinine amidohydrolase